MMTMFNQRFSVLRPTMTENEFGEQVQSLQNIGTRWGEVKQLSGNFYPVGTSQKWLNVLRIKCKYYPSKQINLDHLIEYKGKQYRILEKQLDEDTFPYFVTIKCTGVE